MRGIDSAELARMTATQVESLNDICNIYHFVGTTDSNTGQVKDSWDSGTMNVACGIAVGKEQRNERGQIVSIDADAVLRVAAATTLSAQDKVVAYGKTYAVDGVLPGRNVKIANLLELDV